MGEETKYYPILFNDEMVRAILDGRKTQTRRPVKLIDPSCTYSGVCDGENGKFWPYEVDEGGNSIAKVSPFGGPGDRLWVREAWKLCAWGGSTDHVGVRYRADRQSVGFADIQDKMRTAWRKHGTKWRPNIHMPRVVCRTLLEVTDVRAERVQDITEADIRAEGIRGDTYPELGQPCAEDGRSARIYFMDLWQSIYGTWEENPWVWVGTFQQCEK